MMLQNVFGLRAYCSIEVNAFLQFATFPYCDRTISLVIPQTASALLMTLPLPSSCHLEGLLNMFARGRVVLCTLFMLTCLACHQSHADLLAGAAIVDITPETFPVYINGGFSAKQGEPKNIHARALAFADGETELVMVVADSCMLPKHLLDAAKSMASERTGIPPDHMMIAATHTHTAPSAMGALGTPADETYRPLLRLRLADAIIAAHANLQPAKVAFTSIDAPAFTAVRRWIFSPKHIQTDPFGNKTVRATMYAARHGLEKVTGESGPEDPELSVLSVQTKAGHPLALLANFSMHYFGGGAKGADYFGPYCDALEAKLSETTPKRTRPVVIMSHGCSGDIWRTDLRTGQTIQPIDAFVTGMVDRTLKALRGTRDYTNATLGMEERRLPMNYRVPDVALLEWSQKVAASFEGRLPKTQTEVYAMEQIKLHELQSTEVVVQAIRIGPVAIATTPNETYALTGLKLKRQSPGQHTMVIELANGGDGYIPPPEQHVLGGYNTWPARTAGLEVQAEPRIVEADLEMLETLFDAPRTPLALPNTPASQTVRSLNPRCYYQLDEMNGPIARDSSPHNHHGYFEDGIVFYLEGPKDLHMTATGALNRAAHFAGGRILTHVESLHDDLTLSLWCWNGLASDQRQLLGWLFSHDRPHALSPGGLHIGLQADGENTGRVVVQIGTKRFVGRRPITRWQWHHLAFVRDGDSWQIFVNGKPDCSGIGAAHTGNGNTIFVGGRSDNADSWEGRLDEISIFSRALETSTIKQLAQTHDAQGDTLTQQKKQ